MSFRIQRDVSPGVGVECRNIATVTLDVRVEESRLSAVDDGLQAWRICQSEETKARIVMRRADDRDRFGKGDLVARMSVQVET